MTRLPFDRELLEAPATVVAPLLLGAIIRNGPVAVQLTEVEAYLGELDPGSHAFRGRTARNSAMFGRAGALYTYFTYGMHVCANVVCGEAGTPTAVLLRAGRVIEGVEIARRRRTTSRVDDDLARGPARLTVALGISLADGGTDLVRDASTASPEPVLERGSPVTAWASGPRTGVSGDGGTDRFPWRFYLEQDATVSPYRRHVPKRR